MKKTRKPVYGQHSTKVKKAKFLKAYAECCTVLHACAQIGLDRRTVSRWCESDPDFKRAYEDAQEQAVEQLEAEARRRALVGVKEPVFHKGAVCGYVQKYSDTLLIFLLNAARPEKYRPQLQGADAAQTPVTIVVHTAMGEPPPKVISDTRHLETTPNR